MITLDGPGAGPKSGGKAKHLVVFLHGYGSNGDDLISLAPYWADLLPEAEFLSPNAPFACEENPFGGFQWFGFRDRSPEMIVGGTRAAATILDAYLDQQLQDRGFDESKLALVGFSQGTMMALHVGLRRAASPAAIVGYSGMLVVPEDVDPDTFTAAIRSRPPVLLVHGDQDQLIPVQALMHAAQGLAALEIPAEWHVSAGVGHGIDQEGLRQGGEFIARSFNMRAKA